MVARHMAGSAPSSFIRSSTRSAVGSAISEEIRPSSRNSTRSLNPAAAASWVTITIVWPNSEVALRRNSSSSVPAFESRLPVGSSANTMSGRLARARAAATRCCWPPESSAGRCFRRSSRPTVVTIVFSQSWSGSTPAMSRGRVMFSSAVSVGTRL